MKISEENKQLKTIIEQLKLEIRRKEIKKIKLFGHKKQVNLINDNLKIQTKEKEKLLKKAQYYKKHISQIVILCDNISKLAKFTLHNLDRSNQQYTLATTKFINHIEYIKQNRRNVNFKDGENYGKTYLKEGQKWINELKITSQQTKLKKAANTSSKTNRVYLPIPINMKFQAEKLGASYDPLVKYGSRMFYDLNNKPDLSHPQIQNFLPTAFKNEGEKLLFPPIRYGASKQNIWSFFSRETWDFIRSNKYLSSGNRCVICGQQGGKLIDHGIFPEKKKFSVEAHEVWDWEVQHPETGVGIQKLKEILVVCIDCHMMFHSDYAIEQAKTNRKEDVVRNFLYNKMSLINRVNLERLELDLLNENQKAEQQNGITTWIIDLSHLSQQ
ncbi:MAG: hypothetical protein ACON4M_03730, partial [Crocinitomicaceae bacterium]